VKDVKSEVQLMASADASKSGAGSSASKPAAKKDASATGKGSAATK
jgi:hypothetical protein